MGQKISNGSKILEGIMGQAKTYHGMAKARFRGLKKVQIQFLLTATAINLKKMVKMLEVETKELSISSKILNLIKNLRVFSSIIQKKSIFQLA